MSLSHKGEKCYNWKGGISPERKRLYFTEEYQKWRMDVFLRDNFTCQGCGVRGCYLEAHHIKEWCDYPELRFAIDNGVALCKDCHNLTKKGRKKTS
jgi:5-methylcytosine-specific restriction endonuclease McrA